jgi:hypothetical protein
LRRFDFTTDRVGAAIPDSGVYSLSIDPQELYLYTASTPSRHETSTITQRDLSTGGLIAEKQMVSLENPDVSAAPNGVWVSTSTGNLGYDVLLGTPGLVEGQTQEGKWPITTTNTVEGVFADGTSWLLDAMAARVACVESISLAPYARGRLVWKKNLDNAGIMTAANHRLYVVTPSLATGAYTNPGPSARVAALHPPSGCWRSAL